LRGVVTLRSAIVGIVNSMVSQILSALSRLVAAKIFQLFLKLAGIAVGGPAGAVVGSAAIVGGVAGGGGPTGNVLPPATSLGLVPPSASVKIGDVTQGVMKDLARSVDQLRQQLASQPSQNVTV